MKISKGNIKKIAWAFLVIFVQGMVVPPSVYAITGMEDMPEFKSFEPVSTTDLVNHFNGGFTYNIPLLSVPNGYPINLSYHSSDVTNEAMSSWVGLGWSINPGAINRTKRGFPDEYKKRPIKYHNRMPANWTVSAGGKVKPELFGDENLVNISAGATISYNNYNGLGTSYTAGLGFAGVANLNLSYNNGQFGFNPSINPMALLNKNTWKKDDKTKQQKLGELKDKIKAANGNKKKIRKAKREFNGDKAQAGMSFGGLSAGTKKGSMFGGMLSKTKQSYPTTLAEYKGYMVELSFDAGVNTSPLPIEISEVGVTGTYSRQKNIPTSTKEVFGYNYSEHALDDENTMMDYTTEREKTFTKRDKILGYPVANNDVFNLSGEMIGGSFRPYRSEYGHYRKNKLKSEDFSIQIAADVAAPSVVSFYPGITANFVGSAGGSGGMNYHSTTIGKWDFDSFEDYKFKYDISNENAEEKFHYRYIGDQAGFYDLTAPTGSFSNSYYKPDLSGGIIPDLNFGNFTGVQRVDYRSLGKHKKRSTYINSHATKDFAVKSNDVQYRVYEKNLKILNPQGTPIDYNRSIYSAQNDAVGEYVTYNEEGMTYVYGLPVYAKNDKNLQYSFPGAQGLDFPTESEGLVANVTAGSIDANAKRKLGLEDENTYASTHLLTQVLDPNYIDRTGDGATPDDFGNYTKFNYQQAYGGSETWYGHRTPYKGVSFTAGSLSDHSDDMGSFSYGEKEVYYIKSIESKTHIAYFILGDRQDAQSVNLSNNPNADDLIRGEEGNNKKSLKKLERIELYPLSAGTRTNGVWSPDNNALPIKTVFFEYDDNILSKNLPNNSNTSRGKLALKKVWMESGGVATHKISPYEFKYTYYGSVGTTGAPTLYAAPYNGTSKGDISYYSNIPQTAQLPTYNPANTDRWGQYRDYVTLKSNGAHGIGDLARFWPFVHQNPDDTKYDPAANMLKQIKLPSGGSIHVQYEQHDYHYVQNKVANVMVPLSSSHTATQEMNTNAKKYYLDLDKIGIPFPTTQQEKVDLVDQLFEPMRNNKDRIFFSFLYALMGDNPDYKYTHSDYLDGYARVDSYGYDQYGIYFKFKGGSSISPGATNYEFKIPYSSSASKKELPRKVCLNFYKSQRRLKIDGGNNASTMQSVGANGASEEIAQAFVSILNGLGDSFNANCRSMDPAMSYVRVQVPAGKYRAGGEMYSKLAGGVRVKRVLLYDEGMRAGHPESLYGTEYIYKTNVVPGNSATAEISSGVATNEPSTGRRENALVKPIEKNAQSKLNALLYGRDMYGQEAPIGEAFLPGASIGYSEVRVKPIHQESKTSTGTELHQFYTVKDAPFEYTKSHIQKADLPEIPMGLNASAFGVSLSYERIAPHMVQGYSFISQNMHGKPRRKAKFSAANPNTPISEEMYEYFSPNDMITVMGDDMVKKQVSMQQLGREVEILSEANEVHDFTLSTKVGIDVTTGAFLVGPPVTFPPIAFFSNTDVDVAIGVNDEVIRKHVTSKIVNIPSLTKKITRRSEGITTISENMVFDDNTGKPVITKSYDDFTSGVYVNQDFMGAWSYPNLRSKYQNENLLFTPEGDYKMVGFNDSQGAYYIEFVPNGNQVVCSGLDKFISGDYVELNENDQTEHHLFHIDRVDYQNNRLYLQPSQFDSYHSIPNIIDDIRIWRSGYTNQLNMKVGNTRFFSKTGTPSSVSYTSNYTANNGFVQALNNGLGGLSSTTYNVHIAGTYPNMNVSAWPLNSSSYSSVQCPDLSNATISDVIVDFIVIGGAVPKVEIKVKQFQLLSCIDGKKRTVNCTR